MIDNVFNISKKCISPFEPAMRKIVFQQLLIPATIVHGSLLCTVNVNSCFKTVSIKTFDIKNLLVNAEIIPLVW